MPDADPIGEIRKRRVGVDDATRFRQRARAVTAADRIWQPTKLSGGTPICTGVRLFFSGRLVPPPSDPDAQGDGPAGEAEHRILGL